MITHKELPWCKKFRELICNTDLSESSVIKRYFRYCMEQEAKVKVKLNG